MSSRSRDKESERVKIYAIVGGLCVALKDFTKAEWYLREAIRMDEACLAAYAHLVVICIEQKDEAKLSALWGQVQALGQRKSLSALLIVFGSGYACLGKEWLGKAEGFFRQSLRIVSIGRRGLFGKDGCCDGRYEEAEQLLRLGELSVSEMPFGEFPSRDFMVCFCMAGIKALLGKMEEADTWAVRAGKTHVCRDETSNLQSYLFELRKSNDQERFHEAIRGAIYSLGFSFRVGKIVNSESIVVNEKSFVGYHGTLDDDVKEFEEGIKAENGERIVNLVGRVFMWQRIVKWLATLR